MSAQQESRFEADMSTSFKGIVARRHIDGRHLYVQFDPILEVNGKQYDVGWFDLALAKNDERRSLKEGARVTGTVHVNGSNLAVVENMRKAG